MKKYLFIAAAALLAFAGCNKEEYVPTHVEESITVTPEIMKFQNAGGSCSVLVSSTSDWTLEAASAANTNLVTADKTSGKDGDVVVFTAQANNAATEAVAEYIFKAGRKQATFKAIIKGDGTIVPVIELKSAAALDLVYTTKAIEIKVATNINYRALEYEIPTEAQSWISHKVTISSGEGEATLGFVLEPNAGNENRTAVIKVKAGEGVETQVSVTQRAEPKITPSKMENVIDLAGGTATVTVTANVEYTVSIPAADTWLTYTVEEGVYTFTATATEEKRGTTVTFTEKNPVEGVDPLAVSIIVRQSTPPLITSAADMTGNRAYPVWSTSTKSKLASMTAMTFEALIRCHDFKTSGSLSTLFGVEGGYLIRIGDAGIPSNRLQIAHKTNLAAPSSADLAADTWYHIAVTYNNGTSTIYINGTQVASGTTASGYGSKAINWGIDHNGEYGNSVTRCPWFGYAYDGNRDFRGEVCEVRIWTKVLTADDLAVENHFYTVATDAEGLECYWKMNDSTDEGNTKFKDYTGHGNDMQGELDIHEGTVDSYNAWLGTNGIKPVEVSLPE